MTLRHLYYLLVSDGLLEPIAEEYDRLGNWMVDARMEDRTERLFEAIVDGTRDSIKPSSWSGLEDFADTVRHAYRKDLWAKQNEYIEFWFEKDAILGVVERIANDYDVRMRSLRGQSSLTFIHAAAKELSQIEKPATIYYFGDHDPSGIHIERSARVRLEELLGRIAPMRVWTNLSWQRLAFLPDDLDRGDIQPLRAKRNNLRQNFVAEFGSDRIAELDALPSEEIQMRMQGAIESHIDWLAWEQLQKIEAIEKESFESVMATFGTKG